MSIETNKVRTYYGATGDLMVRASDYHALASDYDEINTDRRKCWEEFKVQGRMLDRAMAERDRLMTDRNNLLCVLQAAVDCGMVPVISAKEGGAAKHSQQVAVADMIRDALSTVSDSAGEGKV